MKKSFLLLMLLLLTIGITVSCENPNTEIEDYTEDPGGGGGSGGGNGGGGGGGSNDRDKRYSVMEFINGDFDEQIWVRGYIVGACYSNIRNANFDPPFEGTSAILLADRPGQRDLDSIIPIQLVSGFRRNIFNLVDNPENYGRVAEFFDYKQIYFNKPGMKGDIGSCILYDKDGKTVLYPKP